MRSSWRRYVSHMREYHSLCLSGNLLLRNRLHDFREKILLVLLLLDYAPFFDENMFPHAEKVDSLYYFQNGGVYPSRPISSSKGKNEEMYDAVVFGDSWGSDNESHPPLSVLENVMARLKPNGKVFIIAPVSDETLNKTVDSELLHLINRLTPFIRLEKRESFGSRWQHYLAEGAGHLGKLLETPGRRKVIVYPRYFIVVAGFLLLYIGQIIMNKIFLKNPLYGGWLLTGRKISV